MKFKKLLVGIFLIGMCSVVWAQEIKIKVSKPWGLPEEVVTNLGNWIAMDGKGSVKARATQVIKNSDESYVVAFSENPADKSGNVYLAIVGKYGRVAAWNTVKLNITIEENNKANSETILVNSDKKTNSETITVSSAGKSKKPQEVKVAQESGWIFVSF